MQGIEVSAVSHAPKMLYYHKMSQKMEIMSNIQPKKFGLNVRRNGPQPSICVRSFSPITNMVNGIDTQLELKTFVFKRRFW